MIDNFSAFDPSTWHGWEDLDDTTAVPSYDIIASAGASSGIGLVFAGVVNAFNSIGNGEYVIQLLPLQSTTNAALRETEISTRLIPNGLQRLTVFSGGVPDSEDARAIIYCRLTVRPFFLPRVDNILVVKGAVLAYGRTFRGDGSTADVAYTACSSAEQFDPGTASLPP